MSSQGPATGVGTGYNGISSANNSCILTGKPSQIPSGYPFNNLSIRDASDWTKYKKQARIINDSKMSKSKDPWFVHGNDFRLDIVNGNNKCASCDANGISGYIVS